jgi:tRNA G10  N-methylase Trm11
MSRLLVTQYQTEVKNLIRYGGSRNETIIRRAFENLLNQYCKPRNYMLVPELDYKTKFNTTVRPDGTVKDAIRLEHGWWEAIVVYDMYTRFFRWATDRLDKNGIIAFITNRSFIDSKTFDGFRKCIERDFDYIYIVDTQSDVRNNPKISGTKNNVFGIQTGIAVMFLVKAQG